MAAGILVYAHAEHEAQFKESWYEKLQDWTQALHAYERLEATQVTRAARVWHAHRQ